MTDAAFLLWAHTLLVWALANYSYRDPLASDSDVKETTERFGSIDRWRLWVISRAFIAAGIVAYLASARLVLAALLLIGAIALPLIRSVFPARRCAELEVVANAVFAAASFTLLKDHAAHVERAVFSIPLAEKRIAAACIVVALLLFTVHGGTTIVRGILKKSGAVPTVKDDVTDGRTLDVKEFNRGRLIGTLERVLLFAVVIAGSYEALGFIVAAKGLIRSREFELSRDMTEYFLIGSLSSVLIALATGSLAKAVLSAYW